MLGLPRDETDASSEVERQLEAARDAKERAAKRIYYRQAVQVAERFLLDHPDSFLVPDVLFDLGDAQKGLGRRAAAKETFERYVERHSFHASVDGARERIEELEGLGGVSGLTSVSAVAQRAVGPTRGRLVSRR